jgi:hypothetical protein
VRDVEFAGDQLGEEQVAGGAEVSVFAMEVRYKPEKAG